MNGDSIYEGYWANDKKQGHGRFIKFGNLMYEGEWHKDAPHGKGHNIDEEGEYKGNFKDGRRNGFGAIIYLDKNSYKGN